MSRLIRIFLAIPLVLTATAALVGQVPDNAAVLEQTLLRGVEMQRGGDVVGAIEAYQTVLKIDPRRVDALSNLGACYVHLGQFEDAITHYNAALAIDPGNATVLLNLGLAYYKSGRPHLAIEPLKAVTASENPPRNAYLILGDSYLQNAQYKEAVEVLKPREALFGDDLGFGYVLGMALLRTDNEEEGQQYIDRIFKAGESAEAHLLMGIAHLNRFDYHPAKAELEKALALKPTLRSANSALARALLGLGDQPAAERAFRKELTVNINDFEANLALGSMRRAAQDFDTALVYLNRALEIHPGDLSARKFIASLKLQTGKVEEAVSILESIAQEAPNLVEVHVQLATAYNRLKRKDDADRERAIVERLNREIQEKEVKSRNPEPAGPDSTPPIPNR
jgi:protein O-GlcNAc transferase